MAARLPGSPLVRLHRCYARCPRWLRWPVLLGLFLRAVEVVPAHALRFIYFVIHGFPGAVLLPECLLAGRHHSRQWGSSAFARAEAYGAGAPTLTEAQRTAYRTEGYLVLRGLLPPATVRSLREELLRIHGLWLFEENSWLLSDALLDFLTFSPLGNVAAQLFGAGRVHLVRNTQHFRASNYYPKILFYHYDFGECEHGLLPVSEVVRTLVKFYIPLYDDMPAFWFVNASSMEALMSRVHNETVLSDFRAGRLTVEHPAYLDAFLPREELDRLSLKPVLNVGDVIVHSTTLVHRSPPETGSWLAGFLAASYGVPESRYAGKGSAETRECDSGIDPASATSFENVTRIADVLRPQCFPQAFPVNSDREAELNVSYREKAFAGPLGWDWKGFYGMTGEHFVLRHLHRLASLWSARGVLFGRRPESTPMPAEHVVEATLEAARRSGAAEL